jgi:glycosyltransferase involved in cell wall biosynthesis
VRRGVLFFADRLPPLIGGMEIHARYFIEFFRPHSYFPLLGVITKNAKGEDCLLINEECQLINLTELSLRFNPAILFFNSGRWIEEMAQIKRDFPQAAFFYRTGGNEIIQASLANLKIFNHSDRQQFWAKTLNKTIDVLITNSFLTEKRLREIGVDVSFERCVGGVNTAALNPVLRQPFQPITLMCAARFVTYKNYPLLLTLIKDLLVEGFCFKVRIAGDGPLLNEIKHQASQLSCEAAIDFLGSLEHEVVCQEIASADIYIQLSIDLVREVLGGSYLHTEGMGRTILEAISAGTYIFAGNCGALSEIVSCERGQLVDLNNYSAVKIALKKLLISPPKRNQKTDEFNWDNFFKKYEIYFLRYNENSISN